ncbi:MAG: UDP-N-acetylmuramoyl-tripeptide--D-alanyl-D-alanine ligase [Paludibacter sp.]|jgi:UDP-N-acetylmuramoyl-tripeptide--D-alanyl-D-alanine ligase
MQLYPIFQKHPLICTDSRNCPSGSIFFALKGDNFNANAFAATALEKGCAYAVVDEIEYALDERFILVDDVLKSLQDLAHYHRQQLGTTIIGITGTNGKTTSKELIASVLSEKFRILFTQGNLNNHIGVPLTLLLLKPEHELAVIEMGANHPGEIKLLSEIACPDYGIITNVGKAHLEGFGSFEGVMKTKAELYDFIAASGKQIFINADNDYLLEMAQKSGILKSDKIIKYSQKGDSADIKVSGQILNCSPFLEMTCKTDSQPFEIKTQLIGSYNAENVLGALAIGQHFGLSDVQIKNGLEKYRPKNNRSQLTVTDRNKLVVDAYNANPTSMTAAILNFAQMEIPNKTLILGDMLELGEYSEIEHQNVVDLLQQNKFSSVLLVGKEFSKTKSNFSCFENVEALMEDIEKNAIVDQIVLIKGSRGIRLEKVLLKL